ncbi:glycosyltransferase [Acetobacter estunensis NRIC 0472]|uniref:Glycosyltransferase n=1 Tax=Acetobacter estunensis TaxID=104097 RepID=A0A967B4E4_9PROT|nr:glycosyltransferase [Acetobacter estunensis]NHO52708.1 glycosyltransferase [Acetobacter estunensis]GBQ22975.1 glycosyltransferase [Acetobacter estunensis NRIC 0472]
MAVIYNTNYTHNPNYYLTLAFERAARTVLGDENVVVADNMTLAGLAAAGEHDVLICIDGQRINMELMRRVRPAFKTMIFWAFEDPFMVPFNVDNMGVFDYVFTNDPSCTEFYGSKGHYLPLAASLSLHERKVKSAADLDYDIFFAGTMWPNRVETLRRVITAFPEARIKLVCPGNEYLPPLPADLADLAIQRPISHEAFIDFANASAVTLTMFRDYASHGDVGQATAPGPRFYELGLAGTAQVVEAGEQLDERYINEVGGVALSRSVEGVVAHIDALLSNKSLRRKQAVAAQKAVLENHLYDHRLRRMMEVTGADFLRHPKTAASVPARRGRLRVLMCTHSTIHEQTWGGVEVYQQTIASMLLRDVEFFYWLHRDGMCRLTDASGREIESFDVPDTGWLDTLCDGAEEMAFSAALSQYNFDIVHFQHLGHHCLSLPIIAKANGVGVVFSAHDFFLISSRYNLLNHELRYCEEDVKWVLAADNSLKRSDNVEFGGEQTRRAFVATMLNSIDTILFGTKHSHDLMHEVYPHLDHKESLTLGIPSPETTAPVLPKPYEPLEGRRLSVAIIGNFLRTKGADAVLGVIEMANPDLFEFHIFGYVHPEYEGILNNLHRSNVHVYGRYSAGDIDALKVADVALNLSIWPETYCISLSEAWQNGLIPIVTDVGALGDRVIDGVNGFKVPIGAPADVLQRLELIRCSETTRKSLMENIGPQLWTNARDYGEALLNVYRDVAPRRDMGSSNVQFDVGQVHLLPHPSWKHQAPPRHIFDPPTTRDLSIELPEVVSDWSSIQGAEYYIDDVCRHVFAEVDDEDFVTASDFHIRGWYVVPGVSGSGHLYAALIGDEESAPIFIPTHREVRSDVGGLFPGAPRRSGFFAQVALRGKWCEGVFRIGLVNVVHGKGSFQLTSIQIEVEGGQIIGIARIPPSNGQILRDFERISESDGLLRGVKLSALAQPITQAFKGDLEFYIDHFSGLIEDGGRHERDDEASDIIIRGWAFLRGLSRAGQVYVAFVNEENGDVLFFATSRLIRQDVQTIFPDAPLCVGFVGNLSLKRGYNEKLNGWYRVCLLNVVGEDGGMRPTNIRVLCEDNEVRSVEQVGLEEVVVGFCDNVGRALVEI